MRTPTSTRALAVLGILAGLTIGAGLLHRWRERTLASNERNAAASLQTLDSAEFDFRANDRDGNGVADFWTGDVAQLFALQDARGEPLGLIDASIAAADARPLNPLTPDPVPKSGYLYVAMETDETGQPYRVDAGGGPAAARPVHHPSKFGFCAYPAAYGRTGRHTFLINEGGTVIKLDTGGRPVLRWPDDGRCYCGQPKDSPHW